MDDEYEDERLRAERREQALCNAFHQDDEDEDEGEDENADEDDDGLESNPHACFDALTRNVRQC